MLELLKKDTFQRVKELLTQTPILTYYDPNKPIMISVDASSYGLGGYFSRRK